jgi:deoxyadenosine/deoxycytidine kinase
MERKYVIIAGGIGTGKTTVAQLLRALIDKCVVVDERRGRYLFEFYEDPRAFAFKNQLDYTIQYLERGIALASEAGVLVQERSIFDTHEVFSRMQLRCGNIDAREFDLLDRMYRIGAGLLRPALLVLLEAETDIAFGRMRARGEPEERLADCTYVAALAEEYRQWFAAFERCPKHRLKTDNESPEALAETIRGLIAEVPCA